MQDVTSRVFIYMSLLKSKQQQQNTKQHTNKQTNNNNNTTNKLSLLFPFVKGQWIFLLFLIFIILKNVFNLVLVFVSRDSFYSPFNVIKHVEIVITKPIPVLASRSDFLYCHRTLTYLRKEMFYLTTHSTHFIYGYMASGIP